MSGPKSLSSSSLRLGRFWRYKINAVSAVALVVIVEVFFQYKNLHGYLRSLEPALKEPRGPWAAAPTANDAAFSPNPGDEDFLFPRYVTDAPPPRAERIRNSRLRLVRAEPNPFLVCNAPKTGSTAWRYFWEYVNNGTFWNASDTRGNPGILHRYYQKMGGMRNWRPSETDAEVVRVFRASDVFVVGRNPYVRFLSSYKHWLNQGKRQRQENPTFAEFVGLVESLKPGEVTLWEAPTDHIKSISVVCEIRGFNATLLRVEDQALWFEAFLTRYNLRGTMDEYVARSGAIVFASGLRGDSRLGDFVPQIAGRVAWPSEIFESRHHRGSAEKVLEYYTPDLAARVTKLVWDDLVNFGYPPWDGRRSFRLV